MTSTTPLTALRDFEADLELLGGILDEVCVASGVESERILAVRSTTVELARRARKMNEKKK